MYTPIDHKQLFKLTPIAIMLASSVFMLAYSLFGMTDINDMMLGAIKKQEHSSSIHSDIYTGITKRSHSLFKILNNPNPNAVIDKYIKDIEQEKQNLQTDQKLCIHNKVKPINTIFVKQKKLLQKYSSLESEIINLIKQGKKDQATSIFNTKLSKQKEVTLNQIIVGKNYIRKSSSNAIKEISRKTFIGISIYGLLNIIFIAISLFLSIRILRKYISNNKALVDSTKRDLLTNLSSRVNFLQEINEQITDHPEKPFAVAFIDIDYFKSINDIYGHALADNLLIKFAKKLSSQLGDVEHCLARFGGDEFVLLIKDINKKDAKVLIENISNAINTSYHPKGRNISLTSSIGVSHYPDDAKTVEILLHNSDLAMYQAKKDGRGCYRIFSQKLNNEMLMKNDISQRLQTSLSNKRNIFLVYQPLLDTQSCDVMECEALLRWNDSKLGNISPTTFIPITEKTNLIKAVNYFVIDQVCKQQTEWRENNNKEIRINLNLAGNQEIFIASLKRLVGRIRNLNLSPSLFGIEITERSLFEINDKTINQLRIINKMGIKISIDDFGTGYSSLLYLSKLPITTLKIDKEFISNICNKEKDNAIILSIIKLGQSLDLDIVAEGVETLNQYEYLKRNSCHIIQGYLFSKPVPPEELMHLEIPVFDSKKRLVA